MNYSDLRQYCIMWGGFHPETKGTISELVGALRSESTGVGRGMILTLARYIDEKEGKVNEPRFSVSR